MTYPGSQSRGPPGLLPCMLPVVLKRAGPTSGAGLGLPQRKSNGEPRDCWTSGPCSGNTVSWFGDLWSPSWTPSLCLPWLFIHESPVACPQAILPPEITSQGASSWTPPLPRGRAWRSPRWRTGCLPSTVGFPERGSTSCHALSGLHGAGERSGNAPGGPRCRRCPSASGLGLHEQTAERKSNTGNLPV